MATTQLPGLMSKLRPARLFRDSRLRNSVHLDGNDGGPYVLLVEVFDSLRLEAPISEIAAVGLDDMNMGQLEELLQTMMEE